MSKSLPYDPGRLTQCAREIISTGRELAARGWLPATSGNLSCRIDAMHVAITVSGCDKSNLAEADVMVVDLAGRAIASDRKPSAETTLHMQLYRRGMQIGSVLHTHSQNQTVAARLYAPCGRVQLRGYELLKAFDGIRTHEAELDVPVLPNTQDLHDLAAQVDARWDSELPSKPMWGYLIEAHGLYAWGGDIASARRHLEALEFLLGCELELRRLTPQPYSVR